MLLALLAATVGCMTCDVRTSMGDEPLQEAIDAASDDDILSVCPGVYQGPLTIERGLSLIAADDGSGVWLDGEGGGPVLTITDAAVLLRGIGIEDGHTGEDGRGGGIWIEQENSLTLPRVTLEDVVIRDHQDSGVVLTGGTLIARNVIVADNTASIGGALRVLGGSVSTDSSELVGNNAELGGAIYVDDGGEVALVRTRVCENRATNGGGAWLVAGVGDEPAGELSSVSSDWCEGDTDNSPDDVATVDDSFLFGDNVDFILTGPSAD